MNLGVDPALRDLAQAVRKASASAPKDHSARAVLESAGLVSRLRTVSDGAPASATLAWCLTFEELGAHCRDFPSARALLHQEACAAGHPAEGTELDLLAGAAYSVGIGRGCLELAQSRAAGQVVGGRRLLEYQGTSHRLAESALELVLARIGLWRAATALTRAQASAVQAEATAGAYLVPSAVASCVSASLTSAHCTVQIFGAAGTSDPAVVDRYQAAYEMAAVCGSPQRLRRTAGARWLAARTTA
jgi:hypothetical protein